MDHRLDTAAMKRGPRWPEPSDRDLRKSASVARTWLPPMNGKRYAGITQIGRRTRKTTEPACTPSRMGPRIAGLENTELFDHWPPSGKRCGRNHGNGERTCRGCAATKETLGALTVR